MKKYFERFQSMNSFLGLLGLKHASSQERGKDPALNIHCSEFEVNNWIISEFVVGTLVPIVGVHPFPLNELFLMVSAVCRLKPNYIVEWGTHLGKSARIFYETSKRFGLDIAIHSVDLPDDTVHQEHPGLQRGVLVNGLREVALHQGDGLTVCLEIYNRLGKPNTTLVFIDGDHNHASVKRELTGVMTQMPDANILLHDTFYQSAASGYNVGPYKAIVEAMAVVPDRYRKLSTDTGLPGMTLLYQLTQLKPPGL
jgi:cephalosporin hydroxylase